MHKRVSRSGHQDHSSTSKRGRAKSKKGTDDSALEIIRVPQNSRNELSKRLGFGDGKVREKSKSSKEKRRPKKDEVGLKDQRDKSKHEKKLVQNISDVQGLVLGKESVKRKEKKEKRDKERLNNIEKYLEGLNKEKKFPRRRSLSLTSSESLLKHISKHVRREKTFHAQTNRDASGGGDPTAKEQKPEKKHKHKESRKKDSSKEKDSRDNQKSVMYCEVQLQSPFLQQKKKYDVERLYPQSLNIKERKRSSSKDNSILPQLQSSSSHQRHKIKRHKEKKVVPNKFSSRKSKINTALRSSKDQRSDASLGPYSKYFVFDHRHLKEKETSHQKKKKRRKMDSATKISHDQKRKRSKEEDIKPERSKEKQEKASSNSDQYKSKIEDDIKSYFCKIQSLIDKKLDFILGSNNSKESKSNPPKDENETVKKKSRKEKKMESKEEQSTRDRNHSRRRKRHGRHKSVEEERRLEENTRERFREEERKETKESRRERDATMASSTSLRRGTKESRRERDATMASSTSLRRERYPSEDSVKYKRRRSPRQVQQREDNPMVPLSFDKRESDKEIKQHRHHKSPYRDRGAYKMSPDRLINMLEHPSTLSLQSNTSLVIKEKLFDDVKRKSNDTGPIENEYHQRKKDAVPVEEQTLPHKDHPKKLKRHVADSSVTFLTQSNTSFVQEKTIDRTKCKPEEHHSRFNEDHHDQKRDKSLTKKNTIPGEDDFKTENTDPVYLQGALNKKLKKPLRHLKNLECKTVSIVGIPSQIRESTIFNETQTTTSLNVISPIEDTVEQKKKSKRFKLYYKYSVADNKCPNESDKSSEGKKSIVSDSYRVVSDPSDHNTDVWEEKGEDSKNVGKGSDEDVAKILFIMKKEKPQNNCGDVTCRHAVVESKKFRKRGDSPKAITLNNILEEPSDISVVIHHNETPSPLKKDIDCTFFNALKSSNSDYDLDLFKKPVHKHKNHKPEKCLEEIVGRPKSSSKKYRREDQQCVKLEKRTKCEEKRGHNKKIRRTESHQKIKKKTTRDMYKYKSQSDINISYDSLRKYKFNKERQSGNSSHLREQLRQLLPELFVKKPSPERKSIDLIIKEELREIIKELPKYMVNKMSSTDDLKQMEAPKPITKPIEEDLKQPQQIQQKEPSDTPKIHDPKEKNVCSKKIGTHHPTTRIPSLIRGYTSTLTLQITKEEHIDARDPTKYVPEEDISDDLVEERKEKNLIDAATDVAVEMADKTVIMLEHKNSQTPNYLHAPIECMLVCDSMKQSACLKKTPNKLKRCQLIDPFTDVKVGCVAKPTRPIINLENNQFPNRKLLETDRRSRPVSSQYKRQKSSMSEGKCVKFEHKETPQSDTVSRKPLEKRPVSAEENPKNKFRRKPSLTVSTNIVTINNTTCAEGDIEKYDNTQAKKNKRTLKNNLDQTCNKRAVITCLEKSRMRGNFSSKSALSLNDVESRIGSLVCVDRPKNFQKMSLNSNSRSLDRYTTKSIIGDNPHASRLFFTKNYNVKMNTYQRRKMYDENIRKKMKKKSPTPNKMAPQVFEVRYLTLENGNLNENSKTIGNLTPVVNQKCISKMPTLNLKISKGKQKVKTTKPSTKKSGKKFPKNKEDACKFSGRDIFAPIISDVDQLNKFRRKMFPEQKVEEIFVKDDSTKKDPTQENTDDSSPVSKDNNIDAKRNFKTNENDLERPDQNFKELIDGLYTSIISYCNTKVNCPQEEHPDNSGKSHSKPSQKTIDGKENIPNTSPFNEKSYVVLPKLPNETVSTKDPTKKSSPTDDNMISEERQLKRPINLLSDHLSCPVLAGSTSSFDYLYEDGSIELNKEAVLLHFKKPLKTILGYALNRTNPIRRETLRKCPGKEDQALNSSIESEESGYSSNDSKKCASVCSFFKKPSILNLFKPVKKLETSLQSTSSLNDSASGPNLQEYNVMNKKCIEYAEKVRNQTQSKEEPGETFQEIPLDILLFCRKSSALLSDFNSNCSLCKKRSHPELPYITEGDELSDNTKELNQLLEVKNKSNKVLLQDDVQAEAIIFYENRHRGSSLEIISFQKSESNFSIDDVPLKEVAQRPVVLSCTNLNSCCLTVVEKLETSNNTFLFGDESSKQENCQFINTDVKSLVLTDFDGKSDATSASRFRHANSTITNKTMAKKFFENLLKVYEKEIHVTNKLFQDDDFFVNVLLESVKSGDVSKTRGIKLKNFIKGKIKNCIGNLFLPRNHIDKSADTETTDGSGDSHQRKLQALAGDARKYFSMFVQAVRTNKDINDEMKICGLLKLIERIEDGDFAILRKKEEVDFEEEIKEQVKEAFVNIYHVSIKEAKKRKRSLSTEDLELIRTFVSKYRIGMLSKTDLIATYIGRGVFKTESHLKAAVTFLIQQNKNKDIDLKDFDEHCKVLVKG